MAYLMERRKGDLETRLSIQDAPVLAPCRLTYISYGAETGDPLSGAAGDPTYGAKIAAVTLSGDRRVVGELWPPLAEVRRLVGR